MGSKKTLVDSNIEAKEKIDDLIGTTTSGDSTKGRSTLYEKKGGYNQAKKDFNSLELSNVKEIKKGDVKIGEVGKLSDGSTVIVRSNSSDGRPTLEIQKGKNKIKLRYD